MVNVSLYNYSGLPNVVNKTIDTALASLSGYLYESTSVTTPILRIENFDLSANYLYIGELSRYYFIKSVRALNNGFFEISCEVDTLYTYKDNILKAVADVSQSESGNKYLSNRDNTRDIRPITEKVSFPDSPFYDSVDNLVLVTLIGD